jgi:hypothetical protein
MVHRHFDFARAAPSDAVRQWANWEGKSPTTRDDLWRRQDKSARPIKVNAALISAAAEVLAGALHLWWVSF